MKFDRQQSPGHLINYLARLFARALYRRIDRHGVTRGQFPVLLVLWEQEGATQTQLAERLAVEQPTMANTLKRMERDGLIVRVPDAEDRRQARIHLTPRGRALEEALIASARETNAVALADLDPAETQQFLALARRVIQNLERDSENPIPGGEP
ncbi:MAG TPA: MarR family transcriptional regulator [Longimicrobium sp.]|nr:MarR family transcriptional regulator [Longimicrobium sp.]